MEIHSRIFDPTHAEEYLQAAITDEEMLLQTMRDIYYGKGQIPQELYFVDRQRIADYTMTEATAKIDTGKGEKVRVLLLGEGEGKGAQEVARQMQAKYADAWREKVEIHMTSLIPYPGIQEALTEQGIFVHTGVLAEQLTSYNLGQFDVIGSDSMLGWTDMNYSIPEIRNSLKSKGVWVGIEGRNTRVSWDNSASDLPGVIENHLRRGQMVPTNSYLDRMNAKHGRGRYADDIYLVRYVKE